MTPCGGLVSGGLVTGGLVSRRACGRRACVLHSSDGVWLRFLVLEFRILTLVAMASAVASAEGDSRVYSEALVVK